MEDEVRELVGEEEAFNRLEAVGMEELDPPGVRRRGW